MSKITIHPSSETTLLFEMKAEINDDLIRLSQDHSVIFITPDQFEQLQKLVLGHKILSDVNKQVQDFTAENHELLVQSLQKLL